MLLSCFYPRYSFRLRQMPQITSRRVAYTEELRRIFYKKQLKTNGNFMTRGNVMHWVRLECWLILLVGMGMAGFSDAQSMAKPQENGEQKEEAQESVKLPEITVKERVVNFAPNTTKAVTKTDIPLIEIPQAVNVVTRSELDARLVQNIDEALAYTPGVSAGVFGPVMREDFFYIRGFEGTQFLNGLLLDTLIYAAPRIEPYGLESVEILKGPASTIYGRTPPSGLVNMTSKRPTAAPVRELFITGGSWDRIQGGLDIGGPVDADGRLMFRLTGLVRNSGTQIRGAKLDRYFIAPSVTWRLGTDTSLTFLSHYQRDETGNTLMHLPPEGTLLPNPHGKISTRSNLGEPGFDRFNRDQYMVGYQFDHRFNDSWRFHQNLRYTDVKVNYPTTFILGFLLDDNGDPQDFRTLDLLAALYKHNAGTFSMDSRLHGKFDTGPVQHNMFVGIDYRYLDGTRRRGFSPDFLVIDAFNPVHGQSFTRPSISTVIDQTRDQIGLYAQNQLKLHRFLLTLGVRNDWTGARTQTHRLSSGSMSQTDQNDSAFTYRTGLTYLFDNGIAPYASYAESFQPVAGTTFDGTPFEPTKGRQYEVGIKFQPVNYNALLTASLFHLEQKNVVTPDLTPGRIGEFLQTGEVRSRGFEVEAKASLMEGLNLIAAYSYTDTKVTESNVPSELGNRLTFIPKNQVRGWLDYTFGTQPFEALRGLGVAWGVRYTSANFGDLTNSLKAPSYTLFDAAVRYDLRYLHPRLKGAQLSVNMNNVFDNKYIASCGNEQCFFGLRRTVLATLRYGW